MPLLRSMNLKLSNFTELNVFQLTSTGVVEAIKRGFDRGEADFGVKARSIVCCIRGLHQYADDVLRIGEPLCYLSLAFWKIHGTLLLQRFISIFDLISIRSCLKLRNVHILGLLVSMWLVVHTEQMSSTSQRLSTCSRFASFHESFSNVLFDLLYKI